MFSKKTIKDIDVSNKKVIVRIDWDVPADENGGVTDDFRIRSSLETVKYLLDQNCSLILLSKRGRPKDGYSEKLSMKKVAEKASQLLGMSVKVVDNIEELQNLNMQSKEIVLLENIRFWPEEKAGDVEFAKKLAGLGDVFVNEAFAMAHRKDASVVGIPQFIPAVAGLNLSNEVEKLSSVIQNPVRPVLAVTGGAKLETKLPLLNKLMELADHIVVAGVMANTLLAAMGRNVGKSIYDENEIEAAKNIIQKAQEKSIQLVLPTEDVGVADTPDSTSRLDKNLSELTDNDMILDFGPKSTQKVLGLLRDSKTIIWNGPLGYYENELFAQASQTLAQAISAREDLVSVVGGGDTADIVNSLDLADKFTHVSTGGGASLELLSGNTLPGVDCLENK